MSDEVGTAERMCSGEEISLNYRDGGSRAGSGMMNWAWMRGGGKADGKKGTSKCGTFVLQQLYPHIVPK